MAGNEEAVSIRKDGSTGKINTPITDRRKHPWRVNQLGANVWNRERPLEYRCPEICR